MHVDDSEVTLNVNICDEFAGAGLSFCGRLDSAAHRNFSQTYEHRLGRAVIHAGRHRHGADAITAGERVNLIMWCTSSSFRMYQRTGDEMRRHDLQSPPDQRCLSRPHDPDFDHWHQILDRGDSV